MVDSTNLPEIDINAIATDLNNKADRDLLNTDIFNELYYKVGDTIEFANYNNNITLGGIVTGNSTNISFTLPLPKRLNKVSNVNISTMVLNIRKVAGGYLPSSAGYEPLIDANTTISTRLFDNLLAVTITRNSAFDVTNNTPVGVSINSLSLTFT